MLKCPTIFITKFNLNFSVICCFLVFQLPLYSCVANREDNKIAQTRRRFSTRPVFSRWHFGVNQPEENPLNNYEWQFVRSKIPVSCSFYNVKLTYYNSQRHDNSSSDTNSRSF